MCRAFAFVKFVFAWFNLHIVESMKLFLSLGLHGGLSSFSCMEVKVPNRESCMKVMNLFKLYTKEMKVSCVVIEFAWLGFCMGLA